jgi:hypothetical protein
LKTISNSAAQSSRKTKSDLVHLRSLPSLEPATGTGRVAWIWPEIEAGLATGKKLREIWEAAQSDGLGIPYAQFRVYVSRLRARRTVQSPPQLETKPLAAVNISAPAIPEEVPRDPFRNLREQREKKQSDGFHYDPFSIQKQLID